MNGQIIDPISYYGCVKCQVQHFEDEPIYKQHILRQSKHGIQEMPKQIRVDMVIKEMEETSEGLILLAPDQHYCERCQQVVSAQIHSDKSGNTYCL